MYLPKDGSHAFTSSRAAKPLPCQQHWLDPSPASVCSSIFGYVLLDVDNVAPASVTDFSPVSDPLGVGGFRGCSSYLSDHRNFQATMPATHPGYACPECGKSYKAKETLTRHRKNHDATAQYTCHLCSSSFRRRDLLSRHVATHESREDGQLRTRRANHSACERCLQRKLRCNG